ncbi:hypothetical protein C8046_12070 [Serinibacter arcticus]|uniref:Integral membrane protein n=1 Tax=Serinibacter arcticus TaxID=1655435 RepID=A0A2U1ZWB7_9MICO|nr:DUF4235 domain-containing protein [Serinibacter arcticus]PWD51285.1 hypothetical protein C8046_12070 [Serinibacter arcticus]
MAETKHEEPASTSAKILYRPFGIVSSMAGGLIASAVFKQVYKRVVKGDKPNAPGPLQSEYNLRQILVAAAIQGVIYSVVKAAIDRGGARTFQKWTGEWPGS